MSDEPSDQSGDGTRATVEDLRGSMDPTAPPTGFGHQDTVDEDESPLLAAPVTSTLVCAGAGYIGSVCGCFTCS